MFDSCEIHDLLNTYKEFPEEAFLPEHGILNPVEVQTQGEGLANYYNLSVDNLKSANSLEGMLKIVMNELLNANMSNVLTAIKEASRDSGKDFIDNDELQAKIYGFLDGVGPTEPKVFDARVRTMLKDAKKLEKQSFSFLISAEYLNDTLVLQSSEDFSPYILQMSRAVESELLLKLFVPFTNFIRAENPNIDLKYEYDSQNRKTSLFSNMVINNRTTYTLGNMCHILQALSDDYLLERSELMKDFYGFINENYSSEIYTDRFVSDLMELSKRYRNKSAHVSVFPRDKVGDCKFLVQKILNNFLKSV